MDFLKDKIKVTLRELDRHRKTLLTGVGGFTYLPCAPKTDNTLPPPNTTGFVPFTGEDWKIGRDSHAWFYKHLVLPQEYHGKQVRFQVLTGTRGWNVNNPQFIVYVDGELRQGLDVNHISLPLGDRGEYDLYLYAYSGALAQDLKFYPSVYVTDEAVEKLWYDLRVPYELLDCLNPLGKEYADILGYLNRAVNLLDLRVAPEGGFAESVRAADELLEKEFYGSWCHTQEKSVICVGHTHIDCAWKWTLAQTREKVQRSFSNVLTNMEAYPEYTFMQSQPLLYQYIKEEAPEVYEGIREKIREGRWEAEGAMWVESDCNLPSGESFVRQFLYGKQFFREELGVNSRVFWVPDVFGYTAALPQIMKKSGVDYFVTSKLSWNEKNRYPYDIFKWRGIDGSEVNAYFLTSQERIEPNRTDYRNRTNYNAHPTAKYITGTFDRMQQKNLTDTVLLPFGAGDGGGGPTRDDLEQVRRLSHGMRSCPQAKMGKVRAFLENLFDANRDNPYLPTWEGELYFELHRGTLTSIAKNKRNNRRSEFLLQDAEQLSAAASSLLGEAYPAEDLHNAWLTVLTNQFHDIIPGSSIDEVYQVSNADYEAVRTTGERIVREKLAALAGKIGTRGGVLVWNPHGCLHRGEVRVGDELVYVTDIPAKGWCVTEPVRGTGSVTVDARVMENAFFRVELDEHAVITRIYDKQNDREVLRAGAKGNRLVAFEDFPKDYDAWEISEYYTEKFWELDDVQSVTPVQDGVRAGLCVERKFLSSTVTQTIWLYEHTPKIDFETAADWHEHHLLLKALFDTDIHTARATCNIQFGNLERSTLKNTTWDTARFEVLAHRFADLSEGDYGVALMNDCKYGYSFGDGQIGLSLIKCATDPNPVADMGEHHFTYSLYPHAGSMEKSDVQALSYELNQPMTATEIWAQTGSLPERFSLVSVDRENVIPETVKLAEDGNGTIVRLYESTNSRTRVAVRFGIPAAQVTVCDLQENELESLPVQDGAVTLTVKPYEIVTLKVR